MKLLEAPSAAAARSRGPDVIGHQTPRGRAFSSPVSTVASATVKVSPLPSRAANVHHSNLRDLILQWLREHPHMRGVQIVAGGPYGLARHSRFREIQRETTAAQRVATDRDVAATLREMVKDDSLRSRFKLRIASGRAGSTWRDMLEGRSHALWRLLHDANLRVKSDHGNTLAPSIAAKAKRGEAIPLGELCRQLLKLRDTEGGTFRVCPFTVKRILGDWGCAVDASDTRPRVHPRAVMGLGGEILRDLESRAGGVVVRDQRVCSELVDGGLVRLSGDVLYALEGSRRPKLSRAANSALAAIQRARKGCTAEEIAGRVSATTRSKVTASQVAAKLAELRDGDAGALVEQASPGRWRLTGLHQASIAFEKRIRDALLSIKKKDPARLRRKIGGPGGVLEELAERGIFWPNLTPDYLERVVGIVPKLKGSRVLSAEYAAELDQLLPFIVKHATIKTAQYPGTRCFRLRTGPRKGTLIPVKRSDGTVIVGSAPGESPRLFPHGNGVCGVLGQKGSPVNPSKRVVQVALRRLGFSTERTGTASDDQKKRLRALKPMVLWALTKTPRVDFHGERIYRLNGRLGLMSRLRSRGVSALAADVAAILDGLKVPRERRYSTKGDEA